MGNRKERNTCGLTVIPGKQSGSKIGEEGGVGGDSDFLNLSNDKDLRWEINLSHVCQIQVTEEYIKFAMIN